MITADTFNAAFKPEADKTDLSLLLRFDLRSLSDTFFLLPFVFLLLATDYLVFRIAYFLR